MATFSDNQSGTFTGPMDNTTFDLVVGRDRLGEYLQAKIGSMFGKKPDEVLLGTPISIPSSYANDEGVIKTMERENGFIKGLRIDLQKRQVHHGVSYATFQVQWGTGMDGKKGGAFAGALLRTDTEFGVGDLREALTRSNQSQTYWRVDP